MRFQNEVEAFEEKVFGALELLELFARVLCTKAVCKLIDLVGGMERIQFTLEAARTRLLYLLSFIV